MTTANRRRYLRRKDTYKIWCAVGSKWVSAIGLDISASGLGLISPVQMERDETEFRAELSERQFVMRAKRVWDQPGMFRGRLVYRYGLEITGIAADDWDALARYCNGQAAVQPNKAQAELSLVRMKADDVARLLPERVQTRLLQMLVERKRLAALDGKTPLVQYSYGGRVEREGIRFHRISIHSRLHERNADQARSFDTLFYLSEDGSIVTIDG